MLALLDALWQFCGSSGADLPSASTLRDGTNTVRKVALSELSEEQINTSASALS
jgi:hypothetical protein